MVVGPEVFEKFLNDAEDALDRTELTISQEEDNYIPWEQVKADLGLRRARDMRFGSPSVRLSPRPQCRDVSNSGCVQLSSY